MRAKKAVITVWDENDIGIEPERVGLKGSPTAVKRTFTPEARTGGEIIKAETAAEAAKIAVARIKALQRA
jgi:electron transfer flavoprotein beta subunit